MDLSAIDMRLRGIIALDGESDVLEHVALTIVSRPPADVLLVVFELEVAGRRPEVPIMQEPRELLDHTIHTKVVLVELTHFLEATSLI